MQTCPSYCLDHAYVSYLTYYDYIIYRMREYETEGMAPW